MIYRTARLLSTLILLIYLPLASGCAPLLRVGGLNQTWEEMSFNFDNNVNLRFPVGTPTSRLINELKGQGFDVSGPAPPNNEFSAYRRVYRFPPICDIAARVYWRADNDGKLISIRGVNREEGCL